MKPVVLIHGYSSESNKTDAASVRAIYGDLPDRLATIVSPSDIVNVNVSRYLSLDDGISIDDVSLAMDRAIKRDYAHLLNGFNTIVHSTGALVARNWIRRHSPKPSPLERIIYLAGANHGSGWAHIGESLVAKWFRMIAQHSQRGLAVLNALELGSSWTIDMHKYFLCPEQDMQSASRTLEFNLIGSQIPAEWALIPIRYGKEDGSDGAIRTSATSLNHAYIRIKPTEQACQIDWEEATAYAKQIGKRRSMQSKNVLDDGLYEVVESSVPGNPYYIKDSEENLFRQRVPFALIYECAHSNPTTGIVYGSETRDSVMEQIERALNTELATDSLATTAQQFDEVTN